MKTKTKLKARRMWCDQELFEDRREVVVCGNKKEFKGDLAVAVISLDDVEALLRTAGDAFAKSYDGHICQSDIVAMLTAIGVLPKKGRK